MIVKAQRQITGACPWNEAPHYLIHNRDRIYGTVGTRRLRAIHSAVGFVVTWTLLSGVYSLRPNVADGTYGQPVSNLWMARIAVFTGFLSALTGTGGPVVLIPILIWIRLPVLTAIGLSQAIQLPIAALASFGNVIYGTPDYVLARLLAAELSIGSWFGEKLVHVTPCTILKRIISEMLVLVGVLILIKVAEYVFR